MKAPQAYQDGITNEIARNAQFTFASRTNDITGSCSFSDLLLSESLSRLTLVNKDRNSKGINYTYQVLAKAKGLAFHAKFFCGRFQIIFLCVASSGTLRSDRPVKYFNDYYGIDYYRFWCS